MEQHPEFSYTARLDRTGRVVIPAEIREMFQLKPGAALTITTSASGRIVLEPALTAVCEAQDYFLSLGAGGELWSDELLAERRLEAKREAEG